MLACANSSDPTDKASQSWPYSISIKGGGKLLFGRLKLVRKSQLKGNFG